MKKTKKLVLMALLTAIALTIFMVEAQIPALVPIPGVKLGLANIITVYAMFALGPFEALAILVVRVILGSIFSGQMTAFMYSLAGGILCWAAMLVMRKLVTAKQIWVCSVIGAIFHNIGQIAVAIFVTGTFAVAAYFPLLLISGIIAGVFTGLSAQLVTARLKKK